MTTLLEQIKERLEKMKKTGLHEFEVGFNRCKHCGVAKVVVDRQSLLITEDKESGGSVREVTTTEYNMEGGPCPKNYGNERNRAISDIQELLPSIIQEVVEELIKTVRIEAINTSRGNEQLNFITLVQLRDILASLKEDTSITFSPKITGKDTILVTEASLKEESK